MAATDGFKHHLRPRLTWHRGNPRYSGRPTCSTFPCMSACIKKPGYKALRKGRCSLPGHVYLVTTVVRGRRPVFRAWSDARCVARVLADPVMWQPHRVLAWVLMPDHRHGLIQLGPRGDLSAVMRQVKSGSARQWARQTGASNSLWERGFHDRAIRRRQDVRKAARYIVANPLRAGLVDDVLLYPYWDALWMHSGGAEGIEAW